jgi:hypothetical protein
VKKFVGLILLFALGLGLYQLLGQQDPLEGEEGAPGKSSRWQSANINKAGQSQGKTEAESNRGNNFNDSNSDPKTTSSKSGVSSQKSENPFLKSTPESDPPSWEEAKRFAYRPINFKPRDEQEASLLEIARTMASTFLVPNSHEKLLAIYEDKGLTPDYSQNSNPHTGKMITIRTQNSLPGVRYPHTQYFSNEQNEMFMQHTSVEYRPGPQAFERVNEMVKELYQVKEGKVSKNGRFINYKLGHGQILWVQKMTAADLKSSPLNAYEESDVGTIRMAIEQEIHFEEEGVDHHMEPDQQSH